MSTLKCTDVTTVDTADLPEDWQPDDMPPRMPVPVRVREMLKAWKEHPADSLMRLGALAVLDSLGYDTRDLTCEREL